MNTAKRMESYGLPGRVHVSAATRQVLGDAFRFEPRGALVRRFQNNGPMGSCCIVDFVAPSVDDWRAMMSPMTANRRSLSSCLELTRMWRNSERASLEKKPSMRLSHEPWVGVKVKVKRPIGCAASQVVVSRETWAEWLSRMTSMAVSAG